MLIREGRKPENSEKNWGNGEIHDAIIACGNFDYLYQILFEQEKFHHETESPKLFYSMEKDKI